VTKATFAPNSDYQRYLKGLTAQQLREMVTDHGIRLDEGEKMLDERDERYDRLEKMSRQANSEWYEKWVAVQRENEALREAAKHLCGALSLWRPGQLPESRDYPDMIMKAWDELACVLVPENLWTTEQWAQEIARTVETNAVQELLDKDG
jgi:hypothetical protein